MMIENFKGFATSKLSWIADKYPEFFSIVKDNLPRANIRTAYRTYVSIILFMSIVAFFLGFSVSFAVMTIFKIQILMRILYSVFASILIAFSTFLVFVFYPSQRADSRGKDIDSNLPFVLTHMGAVAESGIPPYVIFRLISEFKEYGEASKEIERIVRNIDSFGLDPLTSVKDVADKTPSDSLKQVLMGLVTTTESGGNLKTFLKSFGEQAFFDWKMKERGSCSSLAP